MGCAGTDEPLFQELKVQAGDVTLHVRIAGNPKTGNVLVAVNGGPGQSSHYMASLEQLASKEFAVVTYDQRGTGRSTSPSDDDYALLKYVADLDAVRKVVGTEKIHLMGHSWGGILTMRYATIHPEKVNSIMLMGSGPPNIEAAVEGQANLGQRIGELMQQGIIPEVLPTTSAELIEAILPAYFSDPHFMVPDELIETTFSETVSQLTMSAMGNWAFTPEVAMLDHPVLMLWGEYDSFGLPMAEATKNALSNASIEFVVLKQCGHYWHERPGMFFSHVRTFLGLPSIPCEEGPRVGLEPTIQR
ncbi:alpha/beta fold hydrolase [Chloroflexota bacterium]